MKHPMPKTKLLKKPVPVVLHKCLHTNCPEISINQLREHGNKFPTSTISAAQIEQKMNAFSP